MKQDHRPLKGDSILIHEKPTEEIREIAALFSLGILTQHEADSFEAHIREGCPVCEAEHYKFKHIAAEIGLAANEADPPEYIRGLILQRLERQPAKKAPAVESEKEETPAEKPPAAVYRPIILSKPPEKQRNVFPWVLMILFAIAAGFVFYAYYSTQIVNDRLREDIEYERSQRQDLQTLLDQKKDTPKELEEILSVVSKPETRIFHLAGFPPVQAASGAILWDVQRNECLIFGYIPPAPKDKTYQLWFLTSNNEKIPSGLLEPNPDGRIYGWFPIPEDISSLTIVITCEPEGGSRIPTLPYYAIGRND